MSVQGPAGGKKRSRTDDDDETEIEQRRQHQNPAEPDTDSSPEMQEPDTHSSLELSDEEMIGYDRSQLREHIGSKDGPPTRDLVLFFIERAPMSTQRGAKCSFPTCNEKIKEDTYRIAVNPGMLNYYKNSDLYHVQCFEKLADFSQSNYLDRINPLTRVTANLRGVQITSGNYLLDGGAERLILEWKISMGKLIDTRDGTPIQELDSDFNDLLHKSGSPSYRPKKVEGMTDFEFFNLSHQLAPIESDGDEDQDEWNLFEQYFTLKFDKIEDLNERHSLSKMLLLWESDCFLACADEKNLTDQGKEAKSNLSEKAIRAIKRLSTIPMPDFQSAFLGRW